jgi:elongation factor G
MVEAAAEATPNCWRNIWTAALTEDEIKTGLRLRTIRNEIVPMLAGSAFKNRGVQAMLDAVIEYLPSPVDVPAIAGTTKTTDRTPSERRRSVLRAGVQDHDRPVCRPADLLPRVFGRGEFRRHGLQPDQGQKERLGRILQMHANERKEIKEVYAGDIAAAVGLKA